MIAIFAEIRREIEILHRLLKKGKTSRVNSQQIRNNVRAFVYSYFNGVRKEYLCSGQDEQYLADIDSSAQDLLRYAQRRTRKRIYLSALVKMSEAVSELEIKTISRSLGQAGFRPDSVQQKIIDTLRKLSQSAAASYEQGLYDLAGPERLSWRGPAVDFREALRETLDSMAPDAAVAGQPGFSLEPEARGPTMKQKAVFILRSRSQKESQIKPLTQAIDVVEELIGKFIRLVYGRSAHAVHVQVSREEVRKIKDYVSLVLTELLEIRA
jgi:hypothetical protein